MPLQLLVCVLLVSVVRLLALTVASVVALVSTGCGSSGAAAVPGAAAAVETELFGGPGEEHSRRVSELATECAVLNGLEGWTESDTDRIVGSHTVEVSAGAHPSGLSGRDLVAEVGTGLIAATIDGLAEGPLVPVTPPALEPEIRQVIIDGPVTTPDDDAHDLGCVDWARESADEEFDVAGRNALARQYADELDAFLEGSSDFVLLDSEWARCMAEQGFPGLQSPGDQIVQVVEQRSELMAGAIDSNAALEFDRTISLAAWDCSERGSDDRQKLRDEFATAFAEEHDL